MTTYAVIGSGAVGGFYGLNLVRAGAAVHFLIRHPVKPGTPLVLRSPGAGEAEWRFLPGRDCEVAADIDAIPRVDVVLVAVKAMSNQAVAAQVGRLVKPGGGVLLIQNGIGAEPLYAEHLPAGAGLAGGLAFLASYRESPTTFVRVDYGALAVGEYGPGYRAAPSPWLNSVADDLRRAGVAVDVVADLLAARWQKLLWNIPFNGLCTILNATTDRIVGSPEGVALARALMDEVLAAAAADGAPLPQRAADEMIERTIRMAAYAPSMLQDRRAGRAMEIDALFRAPVARARRAGVAMPRTEVLAAELALLT